MLIRRLLLVLAIAGTACAIQSCISRRITTGKLPVEKRMLPDRLSTLESGFKRDFRTLKLMKIDGTIGINGMAENLKGSIAVYRDSLIVMSVVPVMGYEIMRLMCTPDSVIMVNRQEKYYAASSLETYLAKYGIPVDFFDIQSIIANEVFYYKYQTGGRNYRDSINTGEGRRNYIIESFFQGERITSQSFTVDTGELTLNGIFISDYERRMRMNLVYGDFSDTEKDLFPMSLEAGLFENSNSLRMTLHYGQVEFDDSLNVDFTAPGNYKRKEI